MASFLSLQDVEKLPGTPNRFALKSSIKKTRNPFEMSAFHVERSGQMAMHRRGRNLEEVIDWLHRRPWLSFQDWQNSSIDISKRMSAGA
jgi:hypothetical protein